VSAAEAVPWAVRSVEHALRYGAERVAIIPTRGGNGAMEELARRGDFVAPTLAQLEAALDGALALRAPGVVTADLWDAPRLFGAETCSEARLARLARLNRSGAIEAPHHCSACQSTPPSRSNGQ